MNGFKTTGFANGAFYGSGAPGAAPATSHEPFDPTGGGFICFENLSSIVDSGTPKYNISLKNNAGTTNYWPDATVRSAGWGSTSAIGTITVNKALDSSSCALTYVAPDGTCFHGNLNTADGAKNVILKLDA